MRKFPKGAITQIAKEFDLSSNTISAVVNGKRTNKKQSEILKRLTEITENHLSEKKAKETELQQLTAGFQAVASA
ncbi:hypothetical protein [Flavobacterium sp.]|uniref:hypothetical protein n=1 Tax=Flavobacterium sp. TaxID=239 RepID=UPI00374DCB9A